MDDKAVSDKIAPFAELLGKVPDERVAEMAGVDVAEVQAARADAPAPAKAPKGKRKKATEAEPPPTPVAPPPPAPPPVASAPAKAPSVLRVKAGLRIPDGRGGERFVPRSIYRGAVAARLWNDPQVPRDALEILEP